MTSTSLAPGAWRQEEDGVRLLATRCGRCSTYTFPPATACPQCLERTKLTTVPLHKYGTVHAFTVTHIPVSGIEAPYAVAYIDCPEGIRACGRLIEWAEIHLSDTVEAVPGVLRDRPEGQLRGWMFQRVPATVNGEPR